MEEKFKVIIPADLSKSEDGEWKIRGLASTASTDQQGEIMLQEGMDLTPIDKKKGIINWDHKKGPENTLGVLDGYTKSKEGLYIEGRLFKNHDKAKAAYQIMSSLGKSDYGRMGLSVEGVIKERSGKDGRVIKRSVITGVALTMNPVNTDTYVNLTKSLNADQTELEFNASEESFQAPEKGSEPSLASNEASSLYFTADQVIEIVQKALAVGAEKATTTPKQRSGGAALAQEDLDKNLKDTQSRKDKIEGGLADKKKPSDFPKWRLEEGIKVEMEHTNDKKIAEEIAMDHLTEDLNYYKKLKTIEKGGPGSGRRKVTIEGAEGLEHKEADVSEGHGGYHVAKIGKQHHISKDGRIFMPVDSDHPAIKKLKKGSQQWFQKSILEALDSLKLLYPDVKTEILLRALEDRLNTKYGLKDSN